MDDCMIVQLYFDRDEDAIRQTAYKYGARLRAISLGITGNREASEECENDTYMEAWNRIPPADPGEYLYAFLTRIVRAFSIDRCRKRSALKRCGLIMELTSELDSCIPSVGSVEDDVEAKMLGEAISRFLYTLPEEKQIMFVRRYFFTDSVSEISERLSVSESKVKTTLFRIRGDLRTYLVKEGYIL